MLALVTLLLLAPASPPPPSAVPAKPPPPAAGARPANVDAEVPPACRDNVDKTAEHFDALVKPLVDEAQKREDANAERGQAAFEAALAEREAPVRALRAESRSLEAGFSEEDRKRCEDYAYRRFSRSFSRLAPAAAFYNARAGIFRAIGQLFLSAPGR